MKKNKAEKIIKILIACIVLITVFMFFAMIFFQIKRGAFGLEAAMKRFAKDDEDYYMSRIIDNTRGVGYINYDCTPINKIAKGIQKCNGQYVVFADRIDKKWVVDENSKQIMW